MSAPPYYLCKKPQIIKDILPYKGNLGIIIFYFLGVLKQTVAPWDQSTIKVKTPGHRSRAVMAESGGREENLGILGG